MANNKTIQNREGRPFPNATRKFMRYQIGSITRREQMVAKYEEPDGKFLGYEKLMAFEIGVGMRPALAEIFHLKGFGETLEAAEKMAGL